MRLSGWDPEDKSPIFHLLLSCPSITEADSDVQDCHEVLCTYERLAGNDLRSIYQC